MDIVETDLSEVESSPVPTAAANAARAAEKRSRIDALAEWDQLDRVQRRALGLPATDSEWARVNNVHVRRVSKYRDDPYYKTAVAKLDDIAKKRIASAGSAVMPSIAGTPGVDDSADYSAIKSQVASLARQGDQRALDMWLKHWGKPFLDEETANRVADLASMSDEELIVSLVDMVNPLLLSDVLTGRGWEIKMPADAGIPRMAAHGSDT